MTSRAQWTLDDMPDMTGKTVIVTGGNSGLGYQSCKVLLEKNAKVYMAARDSQKSHEAIQRLKEETGKKAVLLPLDLADLHSVRKAAEQYNSLESKLDVLLNNAGTIHVPLNQLTKDGYDELFGVTVLGHFHLTNCLLPSLLAAPEPRVVNISSLAHSWTWSEGIRFDILKGEKPVIRWPNTWIDPWRYYGQSKTGTMLHANELARRYKDKNLIAVSVHPGPVRTTLFRHTNWFFNWIMRTTYASVEEGALNQLYALSDPEVRNLSGKYLVPVAQVGQPAAISQDQALAKKMWDWCEAETEKF